MGPDARDLDAFHFSLALPRGIQPTRGRGHHGFHAGPRRSAPRTATDVRTKGTDLPARCRLIKMNVQPASANELLQMPVIRPELKKPPAPKKGGGQGRTSHG